MGWGQKRLLLSKQKVLERFGRITQIRSSFKMLNSEWFSAHLSHSEIRKYHLSNHYTGQGSS